MATSPDGSSDPGSLWHTVPLWMSYRGLSDGDPQPKGRATATVNSWSPFLPYGPVILGVESLTLWAITFLNVVSEWDFVRQLHARQWCSTRPVMASTPSPAASTRPPPRLVCLGGQSERPPEPDQGDTGTLGPWHQGQRPPGDIPPMYGFWPARDWEARESVRLRKVSILCSSQSSQANPACPPLPAWPPRGRPLSPADPRPCSPSSPRGHRSGPASAAWHLLRGRRLPRIGGRWRQTPCLWEGSQGNRPPFPEPGGKFSSRCSPGLREVGGGTALPRGGTAVHGPSVALPGTDRGGRRVPLAARRGPVSPQFLRELLGGCRWVMSVPPCRGSTSFPQ